MVALLVSPSDLQWAGLDHESRMYNRLKLQDRPADVTCTAMESELELISFRSAEHRGPSEVWTCIRRSQREGSGSNGVCETQRPGV